MKDKIKLAEKGKKVHYSVGKEVRSLEYFAQKAPVKTMKIYNGYK